MASVATARALDAQQPTQHIEHMTIAYRPMRVDSSPALQRVHAGGHVRLRLAIDSSGHALSGSVKIEDATDSALAEFAAEIAKGIVWDSATAVHTAGQGAIRLPFGFTYCEGGVPGKFEPGGSPPEIGYFINRADSTAPATAEAMVVFPQRLSGPMPEYPPQLQEARISGTVMVEAVIDTTGLIDAGSLSVVSSTNRGFDASALRTVGRSVFRAARTPWRAVRIRIHIPISYSIVP